MGFPGAASPPAPALRRAVPVHRAVGVAGRAGGAFQVARAAARRTRVRRARGRTGAPAGRALARRRVRARAGHPDMALAVRGGRRPGTRAAGRGQAQSRLADAQQGAGGEADGTVLYPGAVQGGAVGGAEVGDRDAALGGERHRAVQARDVRVVEGHVGVGGAAHADLAAVQQMDPARVGPGHHVQTGRGFVDLGMRFGVGRGAQGQHGAVDQRRLAERAALGVEPLHARVEHDRRRGGGRRGSLPGDRRGQRGRHRGQGRAGGRRDQHVAARGAGPRLDSPGASGARRGEGRGRRVYDGQPDLHRRQRSLLHGRGLPPPHTSTAASTEGILAPVTDNAPHTRGQVILIGRLCPQKCLTSASPTIS